MIIKIFITVIFFISQVIARNPDAVGSKGMVVSSHELASQIGIDILKDGGNAIDAAIATGFALAVVHPGAGNIGGGGFMIIRLADGTVTTIDFREVAPSGAYRDMFLDDSMNVIKCKIWNTSWAAGVPGFVAGFGMAHEKFGSIKWKKLVRPAAGLAKNGFPLDFQNMMAINHPYYQEFLSNDKETEKIFQTESYQYSDTHLWEPISMNFPLQKTDRKNLLYFSRYPRFVTFFVNREIVTFEVVKMTSYNGDVKL